MRNPMHRIGFWAFYKANIEHQEQVRHQIQMTELLELLEVLQGRVLEMSFGMFLKKVVAIWHSRHSNFQMTVATDEDYASFTQATGFLPPSQRLTMASTSCSMIREYLSSRKSS
mmetsp:Transcript_61954/g.135494  ORF Transcript_61954/g.135494 Transcript_61954/m.135494 type:complete len:114 (-) Transcript_61954:493-834(-)